MTKTRFKFFTRGFRNVASTSGYVGMLVISCWIPLFGYFGSRSLGEHIEGKLNISHIVSQSLFSQSFESFVFFGCHATPLLGDNISKRGVLPIPNSSSFPFIGKEFASLDTTQSLVYPLIGISKSAVIGNSLLNREFGVLQLVKTSGGDLRHPLLEWLGLWRGDGLNDSKKLLGCGDISETHFPVRGREFQLYDIFVQFTSLLSELAFQIAQIASWIITISQYFHNVNNREVPFLFLSVPYCSDLAFIENLNLIFLAHNIIKTSVTGSVCDIVALRTPTSMTELNIFRERATNHCAKLGIIF